MPASASYAPHLGRRVGELQPLAERRGAGVVPGRTHRHLGRLPIETAPLAALLEEDALQLVYFPLDFWAVRFRPFFPGR